jgi:chaperonin GroEL
MRPTKTLLGVKARQAIYQGIMAVYEPVVRSFGPEGRSALIPRSFNRGPRITVDGITIAEQQIPKNPFVRMAADTFKEGCKRTVEKVGDGTTFTVVFAGKLFEIIHRSMSEESALTKTAGVVSLRKQILESAALVKKEILEKRAKKATTLEHLESIASISVKDSELGKVIAKMAHEVGPDGYIDVVEGYKGEIETEVIRGMRFPAKVPNKAFVNNPAKYQMVIADSAILITNYAFDNTGQMLKVMKTLLETTKKITIIAPSFSTEVLNEFFKAMTMVNPENGQRVKRPGIDIFPVAAPALRTEVMEDIAIYCGAELIDKKKRKLESVSTGDLGFIEKMVVKDTEAKEDAVIIGGNGMHDVKRVKTTPIEVEKKGKKVKEYQSEDFITTPIKERIEVLQGQMAETKDNTFKIVIERRIASMASAVGIIRVGSSTNADSLYVKLKVEDAVYACRSALRAGFVRGGGLEAKDIADSDLLEDKDPLKEALRHAYDVIQESVDGGVKITDEIIDPAEAIAFGVEYGASIVANMITVDSITAELDDSFDGEMMIARSIGEVSIALKRNFGLINAAEEEAERERNEAFERIELEDHD